jgi:hypothetical protein
MGVKLLTVHEPLIAHDSPVGVSPGPISVIVKAVTPVPSADTVNSTVPPAEWVPVYFAPAMWYA